MGVVVNGTQIVGIECVTMRTRGQHGVPFAFKSSVLHEVVGNVEAPCIPIAVLEVNQHHAASFVLGMRAWRGEALAHMYRVHCCFAGGTTYTHHVRREQIVVGDYDLGWVLGRRLGQPLDFACQCRLQSNEQRA